MPLISVVVPVYQVKDYVAMMAQSIISQTVGDWEMILVDDGSTDGSGEECDRLALSDARIRVIHQPNSGQGPARNTGLAAAKGEYVFYLDSDDTIATDTFAIFSDLITQEPGFDVVFCGFRRVASTPAPAPYGSVPPVEVFATPQKAQEAFLTRRCRFLTPDTFYRRRWLADNGLTFRAVPYSEDIFNLWECLMTHGRFAYIDAPLYNYLTRPGSVMTGTKLPKIVEGISHFRDLERRMNESAAVSPFVRRFMLPRWALGIMHSGAALCTRSEFRQLCEAVGARDAMRRLVSFPEKKGRLLALLYLFSPRLFYSLCRRY